MRLRSGLGRALATLLLVTSTTAHAFTSSHAAPTARVEAAWTLSSAAAVDAPIRTYVDYAWQRPVRSSAWQRFAAAVPGTWYASWDRATGVPNRIFGEGIQIAGGSADAAIAEQFARAFLADHLDLLAPGARVTDFALVSNVSDGDIRSIGFVQLSHGLRVIGGQIGFEIKRDRVIVIHSEALPDVQVPTVSRLAAVPLAARARDTTIAELGLDASTVSASPPGATQVLPLIADDHVIGYRVVVPVVVDAGLAGRWTVYADAGTGAPIARHSERLLASGTVTYDAITRWSGRPRANYPAARMHAQVNGSAATTAMSGALSWGGLDAASLVATTDGELVKVVHKDATAQTYATSLPAGGAVNWSLASDAELDAELDVFVHAQIVKEYVRTFAPDLHFLDEQLIANVDLPQTCNAYYQDGTINLYSAGNGCANTGTIADVIYHEYEHGVHEHAIIEGLGAFEGALSEGQSDFVAVSITNDSGMGRGFLDNDDPLRELDPADDEWRWPDHAPSPVGEIHQQGMIFGGTMWDLRKALIAQLGATDGVKLMNRLFYAAIQRAPTIPATLVEILAADDDNGNLADGTPHECAILAAYGAHGLRPWTATAAQPGSINPDAGVTTTPIDITLTGLSTRCTSDAIKSIKLAWAPHSGPTSSGSIDMTPGADAIHYHADLPLPGSGYVTNYQIQIAFADGSSLGLPDDFTDRYYTLYQGPTVPLLCTDFESDPFAAGWSHRALAGTDSWSWGTPVATNVGDPGAAWSGTHVVGTGLGTDGHYPAASKMELIAPPVDLGKYSDIHLQYRRWLTVQDGKNDDASINANGETAWQNLATAKNAGRQYHHVDKEWRFDDVPLSGHIAFGNQLALTFELDSDGAFQLGGWNIDDLCVVANANAYCGDGIKQGTEQCDEGANNADNPDVCRTYCRLPSCGDGILDTGEACDDGNKLGDDDCTPSCTLPPPHAGGCCDAGGAPAGSSAIAAMLVGAIVLRRRRR